MEKKKLVSRDQLKQFIKESNLKTAEDVQSMLRDLFSETLQEMLEAELIHSLGYQKNDVKNKQTSNRRNGHTKKTVRSEYGETELLVPRDREGEFEPIIVKKHQKSVAGIEDQILALYAKGVSTREIQDHLRHLYGVEVSPALISNVTNKVMPLVKEWQNRPLQCIYAIVFLDAIHFKVKAEGQMLTVNRNTAFSANKNAAPGQTVAVINLKWFPDALSGNCLPSY